MQFSLLGDMNTQRPSRGPNVDPTETLASEPQNPTITVREYQPSDAAEICSWVRSHSAMRLVSGDDVERLTPQLLRRWLLDIVGALVAVDAKTDRPLGFCTLTRREAPFLPEGTVELCHLIVAPDAKYFWIGSRLCHASRAWGGRLGCHHGYGRVVPTNLWALALARRMRSKEVTDTASWVDKAFRWFELPREPPSQGAV
jgi:RimJ/RimL family protein N-acetyltransferase